MQEHLGAYSFVPFAISLLVTFIFALVWLPEISGTTQEELKAEIARRTSSILLVSHATSNATSNDASNDESEASIGNPIDVEWRRAMDYLKHQEEVDMQRGTYNYGFHPIEPNRISAETHPESDWKSMVGADV